MGRWLGRLEYQGGGAKVVWESTMLGERSGVCPYSRTSDLLLNFILEMRSITVNRSMSK